MKMMVKDKSSHALIKIRITLLIKILAFTAPLTLHKSFKNDAYVFNSAEQNRHVFNQISYHFYCSLLHVSSPLVKSVPYYGIISFVCV